MFQSWRDLLFLHFSLPPDEIQALLPPGLMVDTFPNSRGVEAAWVGLVPFRMEGIRPSRVPAAPWISAFPETNLRTYVHREGKRPGVWFFSLDAARWLACRYARRKFHLPYFHASMSAKRDGNHIIYQSERREAPAAALKIEAEIGDSIPAPQPGSLEFFLVERYLLYAERDARLYSGQVHHPPYPLSRAKVLSSNQTLIGAAGIRESAWEHVCFSDGVDVEVFHLQSDK